MRSLAALLALGMLLGGCAWANRDNRTVWNAFEEHVVPEDDVVFFATLPLTVPGGVLAILLDTLIVHPASVADDAWQDAAEVWDDMEWREGYYTQMAGLPIRAIFSPIVFLGSFLGRSLFDIDPHRSDADKAALEVRRERELVIWFERLAAGSSDSYFGASPSGWSEALQTAFDRALTQAGSIGRYELYRYAQRRQLAPWQDDHAIGLLDRDPVVRYLLLDRWRKRAPVAESVQRALLSDPNAAVRELAAETWPEGVH